MEQRNLFSHILFGQSIFSSIRARAAYSIYVITPYEGLKGNVAEAALFIERVVKKRSEKDTQVN